MNAILLFIATLVSANLAALSYDKYFYEDIGNWCWLGLLLTSSAVLLVLLVHVTTETIDRYMDNEL